MLALTDKSLIELEVRIGGLEAPPLWGGVLMLEIHREIGDIADRVGGEESVFRRIHKILELALILNCLQ